MKGDNLVVAGEEGKHLNTEDNGSELDSETTWKPPLSVRKRSIKCLAI
jgi:hypothetical protein